MLTYQKCKKKEYCQENCAYNPETQKRLSMCQQHWDIYKKSKTKRKSTEIAEVEPEMKRSRIDGQRSNNAQLINQMSMSRSHTETGRQVNLSQVERVHYKEHRKTEKISENEEITTVNSETVRASTRYTQESEVQARTSMCLTKEKITQRNISNFDTNKMFQYYACTKVHEAKRDEILNDLKGTLLHFADIVLKEVQEEIADDESGWSVTPEQVLEKWKDTCGTYISLIIAESVFPYDRFKIISDSMYCRKLTDLEVYNRDSNVFMPENQRLLLQTSIHTKMSDKTEAFVKCRVVSHSDPYDFMNVNIPTCIYSAYVHRWQGRKLTVTPAMLETSTTLAISSPSVSASSLSSSPSLSSSELVECHNYTTFDPVEYKNFVKEFEITMKGFEVDFIKDFYPANYERNKFTLDTLGDIYNECDTHGWDVNNRHLYNQSQVFLDVYSKMDNFMKDNFDHRWVNKMKNYHDRCLQDMELHPDEKYYDNDDESYEEKKKKDDPKEKEKYKQEVMRMIMTAPQRSEEKRIRYANDNYSDYGKKAFAEEWDAAYNMETVNKKFSV